MHPVKKIYCRAFQTVFRIAIPVLPYRKPQTLDGLRSIPGILKEKKADSVLLVTDENLRKLGLTKRLEEFLAEAGIACHVYDKVVPNPTTDNVEAARAVYIAGKCKAIIAFGGGSPMDCAKATAARIARPHKSLPKMKGLLKVMKPTPTIIAVPTTAGSGSETTLAAVITNSENHHKYVINDFVLIPKYAVLDPAVTASLPKHVASTTGMDVLTHAVEAFIGRSTTKDTRADAIEATRLVFENLENACTVNDEESRRNMLHASFLAGSAFTKSYVGYVHAVAHTLGGAYNVPHGLANAVLLPNVLEAYGEAAEERLSILANVIGLSGNTEEEKAKLFIKAIREMNRRLDIPTVIEELQEEDIPRLAKLADAEANPLYPVPVLWDAKELESLYYTVLKED
ncbi:MAG: iron-containing alcohol dehydrogenase [Firmicutes bacterium]|nr:iron-containing alcohol dehydrogenase [Bacillota bacterium]MBQ4093162.1 iron-containing alcohol dehydrogenase [Bacillota bacterium]MBQ6811026.1 iron-containing alcohol dehydrogenase [Bacillota bacterium]